MNFWVFLYRFSWIVLAILAIVLLAGLFLPQIRQYRELERKDAQLEADIRLEEEILAHLKRQQERIQNDPRFVERIAREELGLAKENETVFRFIEEEPPRGPVTP